MWSECLSPLRCAQGQALSAACGSGSPDEEILRCAQDDSQDTAPVRSREAFSPNVYNQVHCEVVAQTRGRAERRACYCGIEGTSLRSQRAELPMFPLRTPGQVQ